MAEKNKEGNFFARTMKRIGRWFREMRSELKKVVWPSFGQVVNNSIVVVASVIVVGVFVWLFDAGFTALLGLFVRG